MATKKKMLQAAAGQAGGAGLDITEVFSTYLYDGNGSTQTITNDIDLDGEGGLVWLKSRTFAGQHVLYDTERGSNSALFSSLTNSAVTSGGSFTLDFNSNGFTTNISGGNINGTGEDEASWTFRKAPKFFDVVTYTGDGVAGRTVSHNLGSVPGCIIVKRLDSGSSWCVYHQGQNGGVNPEQYRILLNSTSAEVDDLGSWNDTAPTDSVFSVGTTGNVNTSGGTYVAYLFAHNDGDGEFGPDGDQDIIKCGSYTGNGSTNGPEIDLGFEPQWVLVKKATAVQGVSQDWFLFDSMRGWLSGSSSVYGNLALRPNSSGAEWDRNDSPYITSTGFQLNDAADRTNGNGDTYIYMAIRRGPLAQPESGTEVFALEDDGASANSEGVYFTSNFPVDFALLRERTNSSDGWYTMSRLQGNGNYMKTNSTAAEASGVSNGTFDHMTGWYQVGSASMSWMWKRAPGFFDVVAYTGTGSARDLPHNLQAVPEMYWIKGRDEARNWIVYADINGTYKEGLLNSSTAFSTASSIGGDPTDSVLKVGTTWNENRANYNYIAYLFATLPGVSKVGSYTGNGSSQTIDCGFTSGARFVLLKNASSIDDWRVFDTARGIVAGNDPMLYLNSTEAEETGGDYIDPQNSGFSLTSNSSVNASGDTYIFYAIA